jgi:hypothetical protein
VSEQVAARSRCLFDPGADPTRPIHVFFSYSSKDKVWRNRIHTHLASLIHEKAIATWHDRDLLAGARWEPKILAELERADIVLLLISPEFVSSPFCYAREMNYALELQSRGQLAVVPIAVSPCDWGEVPFAQLTSIPVRNRPIAKWSNRDEALVCVATGIRRLVQVIRAARGAKSMCQPSFPFPC